MAKKPAAAADLQELPPAMDYAQHRATYNGFMAMVKWGIISAIFIVLALYCFIQAHNALLGTVLLLLIPILIAANAVMGSRRSA